MDETPKPRFIDKPLVYGFNAVKVLFYFTILVFTMLILLYVVSTMMTDAGKNLNFDTSTGPIGDTIGGTLGPFVAMIAAVLTYLAFRIQYDANIQQREDLAKERFENKFFEMLRLHKEGLNELCIKGFMRSTTIDKTFDTEKGTIIKESISVSPVEINGRDVFEAFYEELVACYNICKEVLHFVKFNSSEDKRKYLLQAAYKLCFNGINDNNLTHIDKSILEDQEYLKNFRYHLQKAKIKQLSSADQDVHYRFPGSNIDIKLPNSFKLFSGHVNRLGHYYRHLFMMVKFVAEQDAKVIDYASKREYLRMLRAQLSRFEQLMLYFNYLSGYGVKWENDVNKFFSDFRMIHNLPIELARFASDPRKIFKPQIDRIKQAKEEMFEYDEL